MTAPRVLGLCAMQAIGTVAFNAHAFVPSGNRWAAEDLPIAYRVNAASSPPELGERGAQVAVDSGFASWAAPACTRWRATNAGATTLTRASGRDRENSIVWISEQWPSEIGSADAVIGVTLIVTDRTRSIVSADIQFNNVGFSWAPDSHRVDRRTPVDPISIVTHEEGHFLGLNHSQMRSAVMFAAYMGMPRQKLTNDDVMGVCSIYPSGNRSETGSDAGASGDTCTAQTSCGACMPEEGCGWCEPTKQCMAGADTGPVRGKCADGWSTDLSMCVEEMLGTKVFGELCNRPESCAPGGVCVAAGSMKFCSQSCTTDCNCPSGYRCDLARMDGDKVCVRGAGACAMSAASSAGASPRDEASSGDEGSKSAVKTEGTDGGTAAIMNTNAYDVPQRGNQGCGCVIVANGRGAEPRISVAFVAGVAMLLSRRRRRSRGLNAPLA